MIIGSGLLAKAFSPVYEKATDVCIYAAGVSNSGCVDVFEFNRERDRLKKALALQPENAVFVYFSTCSIYDLEMQDTAYVQHKLAMEQLVSNKKNHLIIRLPQVVGETPNPHTLLNYLYGRIARSERLHIWSNARRNVIDVNDVVSISKIFINDAKIRDLIINIANPQSYSILQIVKTLEGVLNKDAVYELEDKGNEYTIDVQAVLSVIDLTGVNFDAMYLERIIEKYYGNKQR